MKTKTEENYKLNWVLTLYENRNFKEDGDVWQFDQDSTDLTTYPNDEVSAFTLKGDAGVMIEFFNDRNKSKEKSWAEVKLTKDSLEAV